MDEDTNGIVGVNGLPALVLKSRISNQILYFKCLSCGGR